MRRHAEAEILLVQPIAQIVPRTKAGARKVADLIVLIAGIGKCAMRIKIHVVFGLLVGERQAIPRRVKRRTLLDLQPVDRQMLGIKITHKVQRAPKALARLLRNAVHQVEVDVLKSGAPRVVIGAREVGGGMDPPECAQLRVVGALQPEGNAVEPAFAQRAQRAAIYRAGVCLGSDLRALFKRKRIAHAVEQRAKLLCREQRGCAAAEIDGIDRIIRRCGGKILHMQQQRVQIALDLLRGRRRMRTEITVAALAFAKRDVDIDAEFFFFFHVRDGAVSCRRRPA